MQILRVHVLNFVRKLDGKAWNPVFRWHERRAPLIVVETAAGARGIGEGWSRYDDVQTVLDVLVHHVAPALRCLEVAHPLNAASGLRIAAHASLPRWALSAALSAVDIALWDAYGHEHGAPIWRLLGGGDEMAPVYASGGLYRDGYTEQDLAAEVRGYVARGFRAVKMKIAGQPRDADLRRVGAARNALGDGPLLWVDAVNQLTAASAPAWCEALQPFGISAIQAPLPFDDLAGMATINQHCLPVIAAESEFRHDQFEALLAQRSVGHLQYCLPLCGGFSGALELDARAMAAGVTSTPQCFSTAIAQAATLHFAAARPNVVSAEYHGYHDHLSALYRGSTGTVAGGQASAGASPGLGVRIPEPGLQADGSFISLQATARSPG